MNHINIILVTFNSEKTITDCLYSLINQRYVKKNIIIVDNNSSDSTINIVKKIRKKESLKITIIKNKSNLGFGAGVNIGIIEALKNTDNNFILLFNPDAIAEKNLLSLILKQMIREKIDVCSPKILYPNGKIWWIGKNLTSIEDLRRGKVLKISNHLLKGANWSEINQKLCGLKDVDAITGCSMFIRKEVIDKIGMFDKRFFLYAEDADFSVRAKKAGFRLCLCLEATVIHKQEDTRIQLNKNSVKKYYFYLQSSYKFIRKYYGANTALLWIFWLPKNLLVSLWRSFI